MTKIRHPRGSSLGAIVPTFNGRQQSVMVEIIDELNRVSGGGASVLPSRMTEIILDSGQRNILLPLYLQSVDKSLVIKIAVEEERGYLTSLPSLDGLVSLQELLCGGNELTSLPSLPVSLEKLHCAWNQLTSLPSLPNSLLDLDFSNNQLISFPSLPNSLQSLGCQGVSLTSLPSLPVNLITLYCSNNQLTSLPSLPVSLQYLYCGINQLTAEAISQAFIDLDANGLNEGYIDGAGGTNAGLSQLTEAGLIAYNNLLEPIVLDGEGNYVSGRGWTISIND